MDNKELNTMIDKLFMSAKNTYDVAGMIRDIKEKGVGKDTVKDYEIRDYEVNHWALNSKEYYTITKCRRLSDNQEFKINDLTDEGVIKGFHEEDNKLFVRTEEKGGLVSINEIEKVKERVPLFVSTDGKEIFEGGNCWFVGDAWNVYNSGKLLPFDKNEGVTKLPSFSTEENARTYVLEYKPVLSLMDCCIGLPRTDYERLAQIAKQKIKDASN